MTMVRHILYTRVESGHDIMTMLRHTLYTRVQSGDNIMTMVRQTGLNNVCACARSHGSRWRQRPGHHTKLRKNGGVFEKFRMVASLW